LWLGGWARLDSADTSAFLDTESDVAVLSPGFTPGVLDEVVLNAVVGTVADGEDSVVELISTALGDDTTSVRLEDSLVSLNGNGDWAQVESSLELRWAVSGDIVEIRN